MSKEAIQKAVANYFAAFRAMDIEAFVNSFAVDAVVHDPVGEPASEGHEGLRQLFQEMLSNFEKTRMTEDHVFVAGNGAAVKWTVYMMGKNGREVNIEGIDVFEVNEEGKIQKNWSFYDAAEMMAQLQG